MHSDPPTANPRPDARERRARVVGVAVALACMVTAALTLRWPAPGISIALGFAAYLVAGGSPSSGSGARSKH